MKLYRQIDLDRYMNDDWLLGRLDAEAKDQDAGYTTHRWLVDSPPKRMIFGDLYGDLLDSTGLRVLDVGGGYSSLGRALAGRHDYHIVDIMAHDAHGPFAALSDALGGIWTDADWLSFPLDERWDVIVANDIFPNVDQRLAQFIDRYLPMAGELRLSLTFYNTPRAYTVKRVDGDEIFSMLAWDGTQVARCLEPHGIAPDRLEGLSTERDSIFPNGRQVGAVTLRQ